MLSFHKKDSAQTYIIAHRGASGFAYENTVEAFKIAIDMQADAIELDIRKTKDDVLVVHHDPSLKNQKKLLAEMNYAEVLECNKNSAYQVPTLEEVLKLCKDKISLDIELKESGYEKQIVDLVLLYFSIENFLFTSFYKHSLEAIQNLDINISSGYLFHKPLLLNSIPKFVDYLLPHKALCKVGYLKKLEKIGKPIIVWTVDKQKAKEKFVKKNLFGIITNDPSRLE